MATICYWRHAAPHFGHESAIIHYTFGEKDADTRSIEAPLEGGWSLTRHMMQSGKEGDYHEHEDREQVFYVTRGRGKMKVYGTIYETVEGDAVHIPPKAKHQTINDSDDWLELLVISARVHKR